MVYFYGINLSVAVAVGLSHFFGMKQHDNDYLLERGHEQDG
jgi:hypothetical protein